MKFFIAAALLCAMVAGSFAAPAAAPVDGALCPLCEFAMKIVDSKLENNATQEEIIAIVENVCDALPKTIQGECKNLISVFGPKIIDLLVNKLQPNQVCTALGLCSGTKVVKVGGAECALCEFILSEVDKYLDSNRTEQKIIDAVEHVCNVLPGSIKKVCDEFIFEYGPYVIQALVNKIDPSEVCTAIGMCKTKVAVPVNKVKADECALCEFVLSTLSQTLSDNATQQEIVDALEKVCSLLPSSISSECNDLISQYGPAILTALSNDIDPKAVCTEIKLCSGKTRALEVRGGPKCVICEYALKKLDGVLSENSTETDILDAVAHVCSMLPSTVSSECSSLVAEFGPEIYSALVNKIDPKAVCTKIGLCSGARALFTANTRK